MTDRVQDDEMAKFDTGQTSSNGFGGVKNVVTASDEPTVMVRMKSQVGTQAHSVNEV
jgi:hypothetical protein